MGKDGSVDETRTGRGGSARERQIVIRVMTWANVRVGEQSAEAGRANRPILDESFARHDRDELASKPTQRRLW